MAIDKRFINFDGLSFPLSGDVVSIDTEVGPLRGAGLTWAKIEGRMAVTMEIHVRGQEPLHFSAVEDEEGNIQVILPDLTLKPVNEREW